MHEFIDWPRTQQPPRRRRFFLILVVLAGIVFGSRTALSYYVDVLWFRSLGYEDVFLKTLSLQWEVFTAFCGGHISHCVRIVPGFEAGTSPRLAGGSYDCDWRTACKAAGRACSAAHRVRRFAGCCRCNRRGYDRRVANTRA